MKQNDYLKQHEQLHNDETQRFCTRRGENKVFDGRTLGRKFGHKHTLAQVVLEHGPKSVLDYGCGKGKQYHSRKEYGWEIQSAWGKYEQIPTLYDPCWEPYKEKPTGVFDGVICTDVLEHVPLEAEVCLDDVLNDLFNYATKFIFITLSTRKAYKRLPNGQNAHASVFPVEWWKEKIESFRGEKDIDVHAYAEGSNPDFDPDATFKVKDSRGRWVTRKMDKSIVEKII